VVGPLLVVLTLAGGFSFYAQDWIAGAGILCLWVVWALLYKRGSTPVLAVALTYQWVQVTCGIYYYGLTGRRVEAMLASDYRSMVLMGLGCVSALLLGLVIGQKLWPSHWSRLTSDERPWLSWRFLLTAYIVTFLLSGFLQEAAWSLPVLTQGILAFNFARLAFLFLLLRRVVSPKFRWEWFAGLVGVETAMGFTGFFADFREPLVLAALTLLEVFDPRSTRHWFRMTGLATTMLVVGVLWTGIKTSFRQDFNTEELSTRSARLERVSSLSTEWLTNDMEQFLTDMDKLVERLWAIYYPALAVARVPDYLPHENGAILWGALRHIVTPRLLFPEKPALPSDSEMVRKYSGVLVASTDQNTTIAFGYAAESYIDFGVPLMFLPSVAYGIFMGVLYRALQSAFRDYELMVALITVVFWLTLYPWERSWVKTLGLTGTLVIYLGGLVFLMDRFLLRERVLSSAQKYLRPRRETALSRRY